MPRLVALIQRRYVALLGIVLAGVAWLLTATWGVQQVEHEVTVMMPRDIAPHGPVSRVLEDPDGPSRGHFPPMPWYFVGNATSPLPCIVAIDAAYAAAPLAGQRDRYYVFWLFGWWYPVYQSNRWVS